MHPRAHARVRVCSALFATLLLTALAGCTDEEDEKHRSGTDAKPGTAKAALAELPVKAAASKDGYDRAKSFGTAWSDKTDAPGSGNKCDTRNDILRRDLKDPVFDDGKKCVITSGTLADPYTGKTISFQRGGGGGSVDIDHAVALSAAWQTGAQKLTQAKREALANDPLNLIAADGPANRAKGDKDAAAWLPPNKSFACPYVARQIAVKKEYKLWVTSDEGAAMRKVLDTCPAERLPAETSPEVTLKPQN
ncbi:HNH endonuclease family protein [Streptomyces eurocidicus]|uniref:GmrSD restriction endonucleases C-terminal domain-containing protein n=1 Tax=Streptomyces eurocidicus TaxID=66423 RepID=A0A7W8B9T8_STREU|nr:HNH endonuclease family protein [Streptomyces eurocidicus]MBB5119425.1 hypothetical protein [Streptomyces eurocidicus]